MQLELVSLDICPYVQRSAITLEHKGAAYGITYIDLDDPPAWFTQKSPLGKVPILIVREDGEETVLFESAVINEFVDAVTPGTMISDDPLQAALDKGWIEFASEMLQDIHGLILAEQEAALAGHVARLRSLLDRLEGRLGDGPFWHGESLGLVDAAFAPALQRVTLLDQDTGLVGLDDWPRITSWTEKLLATPAVQASVPGGFEERHRRFVREVGGLIRGGREAVASVGAR